jgi:large subunit ribosomal protein L24
MKRKFSISWNASRQPRKQRKYVFNAPLHIRHKLVSANLSKELRKKYGKRSFPLRKGDSVKIMVGEFKKKTGKIASVDLKRLRISIEGIQRTKKDGSKVNVWFDSSNLQIQELNLEDKKRINAISRGKNKQENNKK